MKKTWLYFARRWLSPVFDPVTAMCGVFAYPRYVGDWRRYARLPGAEPLRFNDASPQIRDRTSTTCIDAHYFYTYDSAMRRIVGQMPAQYVDIG